jgi:hypothetical protein
LSVPASIRRSGDRTAVDDVQGAQIGTVDDVFVDLGLKKLLKCADHGPAA